MVDIKRKLQKMSESAKSAIVYTLSTVFSRGLAIITVPIFTRLMTTDQIGEVNLYNSWYSLISVVATLSLTSGGYSVAMKEYPDKRDQYQSSVLSLTSLIALIIAIIYFIAPDFWSRLLGLPNGLMVLMLIGFLVAPARDFWLARQRYEYKYKLSGCVTIGSAILASVLSVVAVLGANSIRFAIEKLDDASLISTVFIIWVILLVLPLFSELEFLGVKVKKEVKKAVEKSNEEVKASLNNLQQLVSQIQISNSVAPQFTINSGLLPSEERIDNLIKEIHLLNEQNKDKQVEQRDEITIPASNLELFKMRYEIEIRIREALELIGYTGKNRTSLMQATYYLNQQGALDPTSTDLIIQMLRIANRGVHGEIIGQKYMDFASQAYPQIIDGLDNCKELIKRMT